MSESKWLYMFTTSGLQRFIFATQKLKEVIGASQLIIDLTEDYLDAALRQAGIPEDSVTTVQRAGGSAILEFSKKRHVETFYQVWPPVVSEVAPGLEFQQWASPLTSDNYFDDLQRGWDALSAGRNIGRPPAPEVAPVALRAPRTGNAAVDRLHYSGEDDEEEQLIDAASARKLEASKHNDDAAAGVAPRDIDDDWWGRKWAVEMGQIADDDSHIALVHADGNRIGGFLIDVADNMTHSGLDAGDIRDFYRIFSDQLAEATKRAVIDAMSAMRDSEDDWAEDQIPARPVVIGGDDVTLILPTDCALDVTEQFLRAFRDQTAAMLDDLRDDFGDLDVLREPQYRHFTACAGITFQKHKYPLVQAADHTEDLCGFAKRQSAVDDGSTASSLMFHLISDSSSVDFETRLHHKFVDQQSQMRIHAGPYGVDGDGLTPISILRDITALLDVADVANNSIREVIDLVHRNRAEAHNAFERAGMVGGDGMDRLQQTLEKARDQRRVDDEDFDELSFLPDAAILHKMEAS